MYAIAACVLKAFQGINCPDDIAWIVIASGHDNNNDDERPRAKDFCNDLQVSVEKARQVVQDYTLYVLSAFNNFDAAEIEGVNLKFV